ncbi:MAG: aminoacyl--tRNA ligase-related protein [bacterium]
MPDFDLKTIADFAKRKGFVYPGSDIYGGLANTWDYGPKGVLLKENIKKAWKQHFIYERNDMVELDAGILMNQKVWEASGHVATFADLLLDCKSCKSRFRADHVVEEKLEVDVEGWPLEKIDSLIEEKKMKCPKCGETNWTKVRYMSGMFETNRDKINNSVNIIKELLEKETDGKVVLNQENIESLKEKLEMQESNRIYLRPETAQGIFVQFKNVMLTERRKLPFGVGQIGKAFRNEITPGNFIFRIVELEQMEIEYFIKPPVEDKDWNDIFEMWLDAQTRFLVDKIGLKPENIRYKEHAKEKLSHYSKRTVDIEYKFPFGWSELTGLAYRTDFDLKAHQTASGVDLTYLDPETNERFIPHVLEPTVGVDRLFLATLCEHYGDEVV